MSTGADPTGQGGVGRRLTTTHNGTTAHAGHKKKRRSSHDRGQGNGHYARRRSSGGWKTHIKKGQISRDSAGTSSAGTSDSDRSRSDDHHVAGHAVSHGNYGGAIGGQGGNQQRRRNAAVGPISPSNGIAPAAPADSRSSPTEHHHHRNRAPNEPLVGEHRLYKSGEGESDGADVRPAAQQPESMSLGRVGRKDEEQESLRRAKDDSAQLRATVERLERELNSVKAGTRMGAGGVVGAQGEGFGLAGGSGGVRWGPPPDPTAGAPWMAGGIAGGISCVQCLMVTIGTCVCFRRPGQPTSNRPKTASTTHHPPSITCGHPCVERLYTRDNLQ